MAASSTQHTNRIDEDSEASNTLVQSAKQGVWAKVFDILDEKRYLINLIPDTRRWGVLHQAVYWNDTSIMKKLLSYTGCDILIRSKACTSEKGETLGKTAENIANMYGYTDMSTILSEFRSTSTKEEVETFAAYNTTLLNRGLIAIGISGFKDTFHPEPIDVNKNIFQVLQSIYSRMRTSDENWKRVRDQVCDTLAVVNPPAMESIRESSSTRYKFFAAIIGDYTREETYLYDHANTVLREQVNSSFLPSAANLALSPYIIVYSMVLLFWSKLPRESGTTYRRVRLTKSQMASYQVGRKFTWLGFVSSSAKLQSAIAFPTCSSATGEHGVVFEIDNRVKSAWQPRDVEAYACYQESERVYPAGAKFEVTRRSTKQGGVYINLRLIN